MENTDYKRDKAIAKVRSMLKLMNVGKQSLDNFDGLCREFDLTIEDVTDWPDIENRFFNPQEI